MPRVGDRVEFSGRSGVLTEGTVFHMKITPRAVTVSIRADDGSVWMRDIAGVTPVSFGGGHDAA